MGVTLTTAVERDARRRRSLAQRPGRLDAALVCVSVLAVALTGAAYAGRTRLTSPADAATVNLNRVADARGLEPVLAPLFETSADTLAWCLFKKGELREAKAAIDLTSHDGIHFT